MPQILILGAGLAGLSTAYHLEKSGLNNNYEIYEKNKRVGGLCRSEKIDDFVFDYAPHILFPKYEHITSLIKKLLGKNLHIQSREAWIYHKYCDTYTRFPFQAHLYGLPSQVVKECILGLFYAYMKDKNQNVQPQNYKDWIYWKFGEGIAKHLMIPYAQKLWTVDLKHMDFNWVKYRVPRPDLEKVLEGALHENPQRFGFNTQFWYPYTGGIEALPQSFLPHIKKVHSKKEATRINPEKRYVEFNGKEKVYYEKLVSTLPPQETLKLMDSVPEDIKRAAQKLQHNSVMCVNLGVDKDQISDKHWIYYYENDFVFHRISFPMNFSKHTAPPKKSSVCTEISYSPTKPLNKESIVERVREDLIKGKILYPEDKILVSDVLDMKYAYIIYDLHHRKNIATVHHFLRNQNIYPCGRFGEWEYFNMDDTLESGRKRAEEIHPD